MTPEEMLRATESELKSCVIEDGHALLRYMLGKLVNWLGYEIEVDSLEQACVNTRGFCMDVLRACPTNSELVHWKGILGATVIEDRLRVSLDVFPYSGGKPLLTKDGKEFAEYVYEVNDSGGEWKLFGWFEDEYGEYEGRFEHDNRGQQTNLLKSGDDIPASGGGI